jgi:hypothetical protein
MSDNRKMFVFDRAAGLERLARAKARFDQIKASAAIPEACGPDIAMAPARGAFATFRPIEIVPGSAGTARPAGYRGPGEVQHRAAIRCADIFDAMTEDARRLHAGRGDNAGPFVPPFTPGQVQVARDYRDLVERHAAVGMKCASIEAVTRGGGQSEFIDAYVTEGIRLAAMIARIGTGAALSVRRLRPIKRGGRARRIILDRTLVDMVCLGQLSLTQVLEAHGWVSKGDTREALRRGLRDCLDRMQGYGPARPQDVG